ncbi:MAG: VOC family protein [Rhodospirillaceae bacterium]|nr:VOC family protein [Rhodospirillaceae bacterium]
MDGTAQTSQEAHASGEPADVPLRGIDHLAIVTDDLEGTLDFYTRVLRMQLVHVRRVPYAADRGQPPYDQLRHYFFDMGNDSLFAVFEYPKGVPQADRDHIGGMQHVAFHTPHRRFDEVRAHVRACGVEITEPIDLGDGFLSVYFYDNNGIRLEISTRVEGYDPSVVQSARQTRSTAKAELETLFDDPADVEKWLDRMPLLDG